MQMKCDTCLCEYEYSEKVIHHWTLFLDGEFKPHCHVCINCEKELGLEIPVVISKIGELRQLKTRLELAAYMPNMSWNYDEMYEFWNDEDKDFDDISEEQKVSMVHAVGFQIWREPDGLALQDMDEANLGDIESERFKDASEICERIEHYFNDYFEEY